MASPAGLFTPQGTDPLADISAQSDCSIFYCKHLLLEGFCLPLFQRPQARSPLGLGTWRSK